MGELHDIHASALYRVVMAILRSREDAEEVVEETLWQAWRTACSFDVTRGDVRRWLFTIGKSRALDRLRRNRSRNYVDLGSLDSGDEFFLTDWDAFKSADTSQSALDTERAGLLRRALATLSINEQQVLALAFFRGLSQTEIAAQTRIPLGTVKTRMRRAMVRLRDALDPAT